MRNEYNLNIQLMKKYLPWILRIAVALILIQTLRFKFTAHPDSVYIFETVGMEPIGRIGIGIAELISAILILIPRTVWLGALMTVGILAGAVMMHLTKLGIEVHDDGGSLFYLGIFTLLLGAIILWIYKHQVPLVGERFKKDQLPS